MIPDTTAMTTAPVDSTLALVKRRPLQLGSTFICAGVDEQT